MMAQSDGPVPPHESGPPVAEPEDRSTSGQSRGVWSFFSQLFRRSSGGIESTLEYLVQSCQQWEEKTSASPPIILSAGLAMETMMHFGYREAAWRIGRWLQERQLPDGSLSESRAPEPVYSATAAATRGWLAALPELSQFETSAQKACVFLRQWVGEEGRLLPPRSRLWNYEPSMLFNEPPDLSPLLWAGRRWPDTDWTTVVLRAIDYWLHHGHRRFPAEQSSAIVRRALFYLDWGHRQEAIPLVEKLDKRQTVSGAVPEQDNGPVILTATVAQASLLWFRMFNESRGEQAYRFLEKRRLPDGSLPRSIRGTSENEREPDPLAAKYYLEATLWRVRCAYRARISHEEALDSEDPRLMMVRSLVAGLPQGSSLADLGCGTGRYLKFLSSWFPYHHWFGIDFVPEALEQIPRGIKTIEAANTYAKEFVEEYNRKFSKKPMNSFDAHRSLEGYDLLKVLSRCEERTLLSDCTFQFNKKFYMVQDISEVRRAKGRKIEVRTSFDGKMRVFLGAQELKVQLYNEIETLPTMSRKEVLAWQPKERRAPSRFHPWKRDYVHSTSRQKRPQTAGVV